VARAKPLTKRSNGALLLLLALALAVAVAVATQHALAEQVGRMLADVWLSTMGAVLGLLGAMFGAH